MEVTYHVVQFDVDPGTFPLLDVGPAGYEQRFDISPVDPGWVGRMKIASKVLRCFFLT